MHIINVILHSRETPLQLHFASSEHADVAANLLAAKRDAIPSCAITYQDDFGKMLACRSHDIYAVFVTSLEAEMEIQVQVALMQARKQQEAQARAPRIALVPGGTA